jgi:hypothetical protein
MTARLLLIPLTIVFSAFPSPASELPDPEFCTVTPCDAMMGVLTTPHSGTGPAATQFVVTVMRDAVTPIPNAFVEIIVRQPANHHLCPGARLTGTTDAQGQVTFNLAMGGCTIDQQALLIRANTADIRLYFRLLSPDYDGQGNGAVTLSDFTVFGAAYVAGAPGCTDYYNDGATGIDDFTSFGACWSLACSQ